MFAPPHILLCARQQCTFQKDEGFAKWAEGYEK